MRRFSRKRLRVGLAALALAVAAILGGLFYFFVQPPALPTVAEAELNYRAKPAIDVPDAVAWNRVGFAKELLNVTDSVVVVDGGPHPVPDPEWRRFKARFPWRKNIDRNLLFQKSFFVRSPYAPPDCSGSACFTLREYRDYTWVELAQPVAVDYIPAETDLIKPEPGHLTVKVIRKCQFLQFTDSIYRMTDGRGNFYVMHATETGEPTTAVSLPAGWTVEPVDLAEPLTLGPFGADGDCYYNVAGDSLGQGYHQYIYAAETYPE